jgi:LmbE family N-acetylglucosaminyl deacetylase
MVISPHPDDVDFGCSGTIAKWSRMGMDISYVICTSGDKGTDLPMAPESIAAIKKRAGGCSEDRWGSKGYLSSFKGRRTRK